MDIKKFLFVSLLFLSLIINNNAFANKYKIKDLEINLFDKSKQLKTTKSIREAFGRVEIKIFAEKTDDSNIGPIIFVMQSRFEKYGQEVRQFYLDYFFNNKKPVFDKEDSNYQIIDKKKTNAFQVKEFDLETYLNTSDDFMEIKRAIKQLYKKNSIKIDDRLLKSDHLYSISNGNAVWISYMFNYEKVFNENLFNNGFSKFHPKNISNFPNYKNYMNKWSALAFKRHEEFQTKLKLNSQIDLKSFGFDNKNDLKYYEKSFYSDKFDFSLDKSPTETKEEKEKKAKEEKERKAKEEKDRKVKEEKERKAKEEKDRKVKEEKERKAKEEKERKAKEEKERKAKEEKERKAKEENLISENELSVDDLMSKIKELNEMYKSGLISKVEFEMLKKKLLKN